MLISCSEVVDYTIWMEHSNLWNDSYRRKRTFFASYAMHAFFRKYIQIDKYMIDVIWDEYDKSLQSEEQMMNKAVLKKIVMGVDSYA